MATVQFAWIEAFHAVALAGTTTEAAELLGIGQPAVSRHISALERRLGVRLFDREARGLRLTEEGRQMLGEAKTALDGFRRFVRVAEEVRMMRKGHLHVIASSPIARGLLPSAMRAFRAAHAAITLSLESVPRPELGRRLEGQQFDLGFVAMPCDYPADALEPIAGFRGACILAPDHALAERAALHLRDLAEAPLISLPTGTVWRTRVERAFDELGLTLRPVVEAQTEIVDLVRAGVGLAVVDPFTAQTAIMSGLISRPVVPAINYEMAFLYPVGHARSRLATEFTHYAREAALSLLSPAPGGDRPID
ncbi:MAG: LysR family transcriptional regulator [Pseudomonadota bacterium]